MNPKETLSHTPDEQVIKEYLLTREHIELPDDIPEDLKIELENDPNPQTLQWVIDESHGDIPLLRLLLARDKLTQGFLDNYERRDEINSSLEPIRQAIANRKKELELDKHYRF